jgi:hypothetical protein
MGGVCIMELAWGSHGACMGLAWGLHAGQIRCMRRLRPVLRSSNRPQPPATARNGPCAHAEGGRDSLVVGGDHVLLEAVGELLLAASGGQAARAALDPQVLGRGAGRNGEQIEAA